MKFSVPREALLKPLQSVANVVERKNAIPILGNVLLVVEETQITLTATDLGVELSTQIQILSSEQGRITVPAKKLLDIVKALPEDADLDFAVEGQRVVLRAGRSRYTLVTLPAEEYPNVESVKEGKQFQIPQSVLRGLISRTHFAMASNDVRYVLMGVLLEVDRGKLRVCATDGHRLAVCEKEGLEGLESFPNTQIVIPRKGVMELLRLLQDSETFAEVIVGTNHIQVILPEVTFTSKLVDGKFPEYQRVLPVRSTSVVIADRDELRRALQRASIISNEKVRGVRIQIEEGKLRIKVVNQEQEEAEEEMSVDYEGNAMEIGFNVEYILDALSGIEEEQVKIGMTTSENSALLQCAESRSCRYVIMPLRL